ncbi:MAG: polynucleotide adenylyltransferase, partial [Treponemataceae bacterium]|nr:polynucleotide adenylyltransferase [Treponemataceae bacterium]
AVNGNDLLALGIPAGRHIGRILHELFQCVLDDPAMNEREQLLRVARSLAEQRLL